MLVCVWPYALETHRQNPASLMQSSGRYTLRAPAAPFGGAGEMTKCRLGCPALTYPDWTWRAIYFTYDEGIGGCSICPEAAMRRSHGVQAARQKRLAFARDQ